MNYIFFCKNCSSTGLESFRRNQATLTQMCVTTIANLQHAAKKEGKPRSLFSKDKEIVPFIEQYWESMTTMPRRITQSWYATVQKTLLKDVNAVFSYDENIEDGQMYGLINVDLTHIKPNYDVQTVKDGLAGKFATIILLTINRVQVRQSWTFLGLFSVQSRVQIQSPLTNCENLLNEWS